MQSEEPIYPRLYPYLYAKEVVFEVAGENRLHFFFDNFCCIGSLLFWQLPSTQTTKLYVYDSSKDKVATFISIPNSETFHRCILTAFYEPYRLITFDTNRTARLREILPESHIDNSSSVKKKMHSILYTFADPYPTKKFCYYENIPDAPLYQIDIGVLTFFDTKTIIFYEKYKKTSNMCDIQFFMLNTNPQETKEELAHSFIIRDLPSELMIKKFDECCNMLIVPNHLNQNMPMKFIHVDLQKKCISHYEIEPGNPSDGVLIDVIRWDKNYFASFYNPTEGEYPIMVLTQINHNQDALKEQINKYEEDKNTVWRQSFPMKSLILEEILQYDSFSKTIIAQCLSTTNEECITMFTPAFNENKTILQRILRLNFAEIIPDPFKFGHLYSYDSSQKGIKVTSYRLTGKIYTVWLMKRAGILGLYGAQALKDVLSLLPN